MRNIDEVFFEGGSSEGEAPEKKRRRIGQMKNYMPDFHRTGFAKHTIAHNKVTSGAGELLIQ